ncbi:hypothetical protein QWY20_18410 [Alkalimonas sp. MEB108]|uniref:Uncharacterized protein n=1 Tax=Alkalimonas cellulosilytica TaxID=3058395 RepID=A0ABU7JAW4_9GAMM|nr:hypothetical protein [Alkalimonas sp. MEB108]MEE2003423.1 hypothetical protein [Alkalimonas sp. MEB108]
MDKKEAATAKERQAKHRAEMQAKGLKPLSVGFVHERYHKALKELVAKVNEGGFSDDLRTKTVTDTAEIDKLKERITALRGALHATKADLNAQMSLVKKQAEQTGELRERLLAFKKVFWRFYWRS